MKRAYADISEGQMHYRYEGTGAVVLLIHMASSSSDEYSRMVAIIGKSYRAIAMDLLGFGESDKAPRPYQVEDHARTIISFMDALKIKKASIVGHHTGSEIGIEIAVTHPARVDKLVLSSPPYFKTQEDLSKHTSGAVYKPVEIDPEGGHLLEWWRRASRYGDSIEIAAERALDFHKAGDRGEELHAAAFTYVPKLPQKLPLIKCPTLVLSGTKDHFYPVIEDIKKLIPRSRVAAIENANPMIARNMPREFAEAVLDFLKNPGV